MARVLTILFAVLALATNINIIFGAKIWNLDSRSIATTSKITKFSAEFYRLLSEFEEGNLICSPLNAYLSMAMVAYGAGGQTKSQLQSALLLPTIPGSEKDFQALIATLDDIKGVEIGLANLLFLTSGYTVDPSYQNALKTYFRSEVSSLDINEQNNAAETFNSWRAKNTQTHAEDLSDLGAKLMLIGGVYFNGTWANLFGAYSTKTADFFVSPNEAPVQVPMMSNVFENINLYTLADLDATCIELPYEAPTSEENFGDHSCSMYVIRPDKVDGLRKIENNLDKVQFNELKNRTSSVLVELPKFNVSKHLDLIPTLREMGIKDMFEPVAHFPGISEAGLQVTNVWQTATITVNEHGGEAIAASEVVAQNSMYIPYDYGHFVVDRPFLCVIVQKSTGLPVFYVRVANPIKSEDNVIDISQA